MGNLSICGKAQLAGRLDANCGGPGPYPMAAHIGAVDVRHALVPVGALGVADRSPLPGYGNDINCSLGEPVCGKASS